MVEIFLDSGVRVHIMDFKILKGDILDASADAMVLPANPKLKEGSGVSELIFKAAGRKQLSKKCDEMRWFPNGLMVTITSMSF